MESYCIAITHSGTRCTFRSQPNSQLCGIHSNSLNAVQTRTESAFDITATDFKECFESMNTMIQDMNNLEHHYQIQRTHQMSLIDNQSRNMRNIFLQVQESVSQQREEERQALRRQNMEYQYYLNQRIQEDLDNPPIINLDASSEIDSDSESEWEEPEEEDPPPAPPIDELVCVTNRVNNSTTVYQSSCPICQENIEFKDAITLNCSHHYHLNCINQWLTLGKETCPMCRGKIQDDSDSLKHAISLSLLSTVVEVE